MPVFNQYSALLQQARRALPAVPLLMTKRCRFAPKPLKQHGRFQSILRPLAAGTARFTGRAVIDDKTLSLRSKTALNSMARFQSILRPAMQQARRALPAVAFIDGKTLSLHSKTASAAWRYQSIFRPVAAGTARLPAVPLLMTKRWPTFQNAGPLSH